jgi:hypothetical protein
VRSHGIDTIRCHADVHVVAVVVGVDDVDRVGIYAREMRRVKGLFATILPRARSWLLDTKDAIARWRDRKVARAKCWSRHLWLSNIVVRMISVSRVEPAFAFLFPWDSDFDTAAGTRLTRRAGARAERPAWLPNRYHDTVG